MGNALEVQGKRTSKTPRFWCAGEVVDEPITTQFGSLKERSNLLKCAKCHRPLLLPLRNIQVQS